MRTHSDVLQGGGRPYIRVAFSPKTQSYTAALPSNGPLCTAALISIILQPLYIAWNCKLRTAMERRVLVSGQRDHERHKQLTLDVLRQFRLIYGSVRHHFRQVEDACGVSGSQIWMLHELQSAPGIGVSDLAHRLSIHQTTCSQLVEKLVARGYVAKTRSERDQRRVGLTITRSAAKVLQNAPGPAEGLIPEALLGFSDAALQSLTTHLGKLIDGLQLKDQQAADKPLSDL